MHDAFLRTSSVRYASWYAPWSWGKSGGAVDASAMSPPQQVPIANFSNNPTSEFVADAEPVTTATPELAPAGIDKAAVVDGASDGASPIAESATTTSNPQTLDELFGVDPVKDTLPPDAIEFDPTRLIDHVGQMKEMGLDYGYGMTTLMQQGLEAIYISSGWGWAGSIMAAAVAVRCVTFALQAMTSDKAAVMASLGPITKPLQDKMEDAIARGDKQAADMYRMQQQEAIRPFIGGMASMGGFMIAQGWIGISAFRLMRAMAELPIPGMTTDGFLWFSDLTTRDPYFFLPVATTAMMYTVFKLGGETGLQTASKSQKTMMTVMAFFLGAVTAFQAAAIQIYFFTSALLGGMTGWLLRQNKFRRFIRIRPIPSKESLELYTPIVQGKMKLSNIKTTTGSSRVRYQAPTPRSSSGTTRRSLSDIKIKADAPLPAHLKPEAKPINRERPDRDVDYEEGTKGLTIPEKLDYYRRNYRLSFIYRRMNSGADAWMSKMGYGGKKMTPELARKKKREEDYEIERRRRFENRS
ncbi:mitochondrial export translocase Oxa1 [Pyrenophora tritici-repentis]|nr:mitochondrial export translocase Oxa1 [Pyrenophora tritici-repentis]KAF7568730.1 YidC, Preprotein translocase subunit YidC [Pyrenophora tritici-repentis]KAG9376330.1 mitochondrial export translocase Oxa1 [Pyrenophora tritici-repentis]KAI0578576.1 mitochondrial export translocase Oxa1 [Pyrenophora tritici-repentis]KAI1511807.1 mitochondrial export translocase Oxa1 [Pyrenophora tritici-repentis]